MTFAEQPERPRPEGREAQAQAAPTAQPPASFSAAPASPDDAGEGHSPTHRIEVLDPSDTRALAGLSEVLVDCVTGGASVSFLPPLSRERALGFWQGVADGQRQGDRVVLVARDAHGRIDGTVQLVPASAQNQPHRADVSKLLVHRRARRLGLATRLLRELEAHARRLGRWVLVLDTETGSAAERLYRQVGYEVAGVIPDFALNHHGQLTPTTVMLRRLARD